MKNSGSKSAISSSVSLVTKYSFKDTIHNKKDYYLGLCTIILVVSFVSLLQCIITGSQLLILRISERQVGESDIVLTADTSSTSGIMFVNYTKVFNDLDPKITEGAVPRWMLPGKLVLETSSSLSTLNEKNIGIGKEWKYNKLNEKEIIITSSASREMNILIGDFINIFVNISDYLKTVDFESEQGQNFLHSLNLSRSDLEGQYITKNGLFYDFYTKDTIYKIPNVSINKYIPEYYEQKLNNGETIPLYDIIIYILKSELVINQEMTVIGTIDKPNGKWPLNLGNVVYIESDTIPSLIMESNPLLTMEYSGNILAGTDMDTMLNKETDNIDNKQKQKDIYNQLKNYAMQVIIQFKDRNNIYTSSSLEDTFTQYANDILNSLSSSSSSSTYNIIYTSPSYTVTPTYPLYLALSNLSFVNILLNQICIMVDILLCILGGYVIYCLLMTNIDVKTYEYGLLRSFGLSSPSLISIVIFQTLYFVIPGIIIGILFCFIGYYIMRWILLSTLFIEMNMIPPLSAIYIGVIIGICIPLLSLLPPLYKLFSQSINKALDIYHQDVNGMIVTLVDTRKIGFSIPLCTIAILLTCIGIGIFYIVPLSFAYKKLNIFFGTLNILLILLLLGLVMLSQFIQSWIQSGFLHFVSCFKPLSHGRHHALLANMHKSHGNKYKQVSLVLSIGICFVVFVNCLFALESKILTLSIANTYPGDILITGNTLPETIINPILDYYKQQPFEYIKHSISLPPALGSLPFISPFSLSSIAGIPSFPVKIYTYPQDYINVINLSLLVQTKSRANKGTQILNGLYNAKYNDYPIKYEYKDIYKNNDATSGPEGSISLSDIYTNILYIIIPDYLQKQLTSDLDIPVIIKTRSNLNIAYTLLSSVYGYMSRFPGLLSFSSYSIYTDTPEIIQGIYNNLFIYIDMYSITSPTSHYIHSHGDINIPIYSKDDLNSDKNGIEIESLSISSLPISTYIIKLFPSITSFQRESIINRLEREINDDTIIITDVPQLTVFIEDIDLGLNLFSVFICILDGILFLFALLIVYTSTITENSKEMGILRSLGVNQSQLYVLYLYDGLSVVVSSYLLGICIGIISAVILTIQTELFTETPFIFVFPTVIVLVFLVILPIAQLARGIQK
ncbi:hypothetical protein WA158_001395 [Blastocystis sp. Blastoise]